MQQDFADPETVFLIRTQGKRSGVIFGDERISKSGSKVRGDAVLKVVDSWM
jgi:hypothetical protein